MSCPTRYICLPPPLVESCPPLLLSFSSSLLQLPLLLSSFLLQYLSPSVSLPLRYILASYPLVLPVLLLSTTDWEQLLEVSDAEISAPKWISQAEQKARDEEARKQRDASAGDANVERALNMMMGGTLAGANALSKLEQVMTKPANLEVGENEELTEEQQQKLKEWEAQYKVRPAPAPCPYLLTCICQAFLAEQDAYAKSLEGEAKKLKSEMAEESKKFDDQLLELTELRMRTEYKLIELELYKVKLVQAIAQEEDDILARQSLVLGLEELKYRHDLAEKAVRDYLEEVKTYELSVDAVRQEGANLEKALRKELQEQAADKETIDQAVRAFKKRGRLEEILQGFGADVIQRLEQLVAEARDQDEVVQEHVAQLDNMRNELKRLEWAKTQIEESIETAEEELKKLLERMARAEYDLDLTVGMKQGQVEVEQSIFITDYSDAELVERSEISTFNGAIKTRGSDKIAVLNEIKEFRKGIHLLQWENQRLELQEEDCLQKTKDLQARGAEVMRGADEQFGSCYESPRACRDSSRGHQVKVRVPRKPRGKEPVPLYAPPLI
eukprot:757218-Hanusia_phi.AAC.2